MFAVRTMGTEYTPPGVTLEVLTASVTAEPAPPLGIKLAAGENTQLVATGNHGHESETGTLKPPKPVTVRGTVAVLPVSTGAGVNALEVIVTSLTVSTAGRDFVCPPADALIEKLYVPGGDEDVVDTVIV